MTGPVPNHPPQTEPTRPNSGSGFLAENLFLLGILSLLVGILAGGCALSFKQPGFLVFAAIPFATGVLLVGLAKRVSRKPAPRDSRPGDDSG